MKIVQALEDSNILLKGVTKTIKNEIKEQDSQPDPGGEGGVKIFIFWSGGRARWTPSPSLEKIE